MYVKIKANIGQFCRDLKSITEGKIIIPILTIGKQSERFGQRLAIPLPGEKRLIDDC